MKKNAYCALILLAIILNGVVGNDVRAQEAGLSVNERRSLAQSFLSKMKSGFTEADRFLKGQTIELSVKQEAILVEGEVRTKGKPNDLIENLNGTIWRKVVNKDELHTYRSEFNVISTRLITGKTQITIQSEIQPELGFEPVTPDLEDVYFSTLKQNVVEEAVS